mmetsp:Transcript_95365/g.205772  ORF Transcript_95365/g.205772 Transcript_95365/m.205772 type:complete len:84 (+) Transcript_95365:751-1002(+)
MHNTNSSSLDSMNQKSNISLSIGIISPYKKQVNKMKKLLMNPNNKHIKPFVEIETVDGFQGREKDIILFSSVRSGNTVGFLKD